ncbi:MAG: hypothetical protein ACJAY8_000073 [Sphingobacteriales bacterium]|jgi:hypothetical protein
MKSLFYLRLLILGVVILSFGCLKDFEKININGVQPTLALPIINSKLGVYHILARDDSSQLVQPTDDGELALVYNTSFSGPNSAVFSFPDIVFSESFSFEHPGNDIRIDSSIDYRTEVVQEINIPAPKLSSAVLESGTFRVTIFNSFKNARLLLEFPGIITADNARVSIDKDLAIGETSIPISLKNASIDFSLNGQEVNTIRANMQLIIDYDEQYSQPTQERIEFSFDFSDLEFETLEGNFGGLALFEISDSILLNLFKSSQEGELGLADPRIRISSHSNIGLPISLAFNELSTVDSENNTRNELNFGKTSHPFVLPHPQNQGNTADGEVIIDHNNSNIDELLVPKNQTFFVDFAMKIDSSTSDVKDFLQKDASFEMDIDFELPLAGYANNWKMVDTMDFSLSFKQELLTSLDFKIIINNGFPIGSDLQIYFLDDNYTVIDSLIDEDKQFIVPAKTNQEGRVIEFSPTVNVVRLPKERAENVFRSSYIILEATIETFNGPQQQIIRFYDDYFIEIKVGVLGKFQIEI